MTIYARSGHYFEKIVSYEKVVPDHSFITSWLQQWNKSTLL